MAVFVDDMYKFKMGQFGRMKMSHLTADTTAELMEMADKIGVNRKWLQCRGTWKEHFDICVSKRKLAIKFGAFPCSMAESVKRCMKRQTEKVNQ